MGVPSLIMKKILFFTIAILLSLLSEALSIPLMENGSVLRAKRSPISRRQVSQSSEEESSEESGGVSSSEEDVTDIDVEVFTQPGPVIRNGRQRRQRNKRQVVSSEESDELNGISSEE